MFFVFSMIIMDRIFIMKWKIVRNSTICYSKSFFACRAILLHEIHHIHADNKNGMKIQLCSDYFQFFKFCSLAHFMQFFGRLYHLTIESWYYYTYPIRDSDASPFNVCVPWFSLIFTRKFHTLHILIA